VPGRISLVPFHFFVGNGDPGSGRHHAFAVDDDRHIVIAIDLESIRFKRIGFAAAGHMAQEGRRIYFRRGRPRRRPDSGD